MSNPETNGRVFRPGASQLAGVAILLACACQAVPDASKPAESSEASFVQPATRAQPAPASPAESSGARPAVVPASVTAPIEPTPATTTAAFAASPAVPNESRMLEALARAVRETPFSAVVQHLSVDVVPLGSEEEKHVYQVRVIESIRGPAPKKLSYFLVAERGEKPSFSKEPVILTLCKNADGFYWPGVGAKFPKTDKTLAVVSAIKPQLSASQTVFPDCD